MATFGKTTQGANGNELFSANLVAVYKYTAGSTGTFQNGYAYITADTNASNMLLRFLIYADDGAGNVPVGASPLGISAEYSIPSTTPTGWYAFSFSSSVSLTSGTSYHLGWWCGRNNNNIGGISKDNAGGSEHFNSSETYSSTGNPPNAPRSSGGTNNASIYLDNGTAFIPFRGTLLDVGN